MSGAGSLEGWRQGKAAADEVNLRGQKALTEKPKLIDGRIKGMNFQNDALKDLKENLAKSIYGITPTEAKAKNICIRCKKSPTFSTEIGKNEYRISGLCEPCFDELTREEE